MNGPALFGYGFRPFFLFGSLWAAIAVILWVPQYLGALALPIAMPPLDWHIHELLYGYLGAVVTGFLLTSIPNWTGRFPLAGTPLMALFGLWLAGRLAMLGSDLLGAATAAIIDAAFLIAVAAVCCREILAGRNWRNLRVVAVLSLLAGSNVLFHAETMLAGTSGYGRRLGIAAAITLIIVVGGRVVPSFTRNWLARGNPGRLPRPFSLVDALAIGLAILGLALWILAPDSSATGIALALGGLAQAIRQARWAGDRTVGNAMVLILHASYAFVPIGFLLLAAAIAWPGAVPASAGQHVWTAGAMGGMTLAVMTRATLGHTGRAIEAGRGTKFIYGMVLLAAALRVAAAFAWPVPLLHAAACAWIAAFGGFAVVYGPMILRQRLR